MEQERVCKLVAQELALRARDRSAALITVAAEVIERYRGGKTARPARLRGFDRQDTRAAPRRLDAAWVHYKLDLGIDHVLVDEAQDTSPKQWEIIKMLVAEFLPGGARENVRRTCSRSATRSSRSSRFRARCRTNSPRCAVTFVRCTKRATVAFATEKLDYSFRSAVGILNAVDAVFKQPAAFRGLTTDPARTVHQALPDAVAWRSGNLGSDEPDKNDRARKRWDAPFDTTSETSPSVKLARQDRAAR